MTTPLPSTNMNPNLNPTPPMPRKKGCGCCAWGCFTLIILSAVFLVGGYFGIKYSADFIFSDSTVKWTYYKFVRPKVEQMLPPNLSGPEKTRILEQADSTLEAFLALPPEAKKEMKKEALTALYYYGQGQVIPPDKIPNLHKFIQEQMDSYERRPLNSPRLLQ